VNTVASKLLSIEHELSLTDLHNRRNELPS